MRYENEDLQDMLAAEFALGNLRGAARSRLVTLMRRHPGLRRKVERWEERLFPLVVSAPPVRTPPRVWRAIHARIAPRADWARRGCRRVAWAGFAFALAVLVYVGIPIPRPGAHTTVAVLSDAQAQPAVLVSWTPRQAAAGRVSVRVLAHPDMPPGTSWQAWLVSGRDAAPVSLGLVGAEPNQVLEISAAAADALLSATAIGISVEPKGGSPTGRPGGAFLFQGPALRVDG
jgi:anti-sigma-K factor RskA